MRPFPFSPTRFGVALFLAMLASSQVTLAAPAPPQILKDFNDETQLADLQIGEGTGQVENGALKLDLNPSEGWPQLHMVPAKPWDWRGKSLAFTITNTGDKEVAVGLRLDDDEKADGWKHSWTGNATLTPGQKTQIFLPMGAAPMDFGMRGFPPITDAEGTTRMKGWGEKSIDTSHVTTWQLFVAKPKDPVHLLIDDISLLSADENNLDGLIDQFGQSTRSDWPGKTHDEAELKAKGEAEKQALAEVAGSEDLDSYGGWKKGPQLEAAGFFRTQQVDGKWWLVDPEGHLFFSSGVDVVQAENPTIIGGRDKMFATIPAADTDLGQFRGQIGDVLRGPGKGQPTFDFGRANLYRKYGADWQTTWNHNSLARLRSWGFNTVGNWSDGNLKVGENRMPYVSTLGIWGDHARLSDGEDYWAKMHDPFDPKFAEDAARAFTEGVEKVKDDPYCLGYFVENELSLGSGSSDQPKAYFGLVYGALSAPAGQPAKAALIAQLKRRYSEIGKLNKVWGTSFATWEAMNAPYQATDKPSDLMKADFADFLTALASQYFRVVAEQLKKVDPNHLYLGSRFSGKPPLEVSKAAAQNCDVVSYNIYAPEIDDSWKFLDGLNKPVIIGEFHIGATDRGSWVPGLVEAKDQNERAEMFKRYVRSVLDNPNFVGCHWFQWEDEPATGRPLDGESFGIGLVDIADTPYAEMVTAAKEVNGEIYTRRLGK